MARGSNASTASVMLVSIIFGMERLVGQTPNVSAEASTGV